MRRAIERGEIAMKDADLAAAAALGAVLKPAVFKLYGRLPGPLSERAEELAAAAARCSRGKAGASLGRLASARGRAITKGTGVFRCAPRTPKPSASPTIARPIT